MLSHALFITILTLSTFEYGDSITCPSECHTKSCCEVSLGDFRCCPYENGVCCHDRRTCCPQGSKCNEGFNKCSLLGNKFLNFGNDFSQIFVPKELYITKPDRPQNYVICPDRKSTCDDNTTCCRISSELWGCCKYPNAICCKDGQHCCPEGHLCDLEHRKCIKSNIVSQISLKSKLSSESYLEKHSSDFNVCPGEYTVCSRNATCCNTSTGWSCCPLPNAECCSDGFHCCPSGTKCDNSLGSCVTSVPHLPSKYPQLVHLSTLTSVRLNPQKLSGSNLQFQPQKSKFMMAFVGQVCPDPKYECPSRTTCCVGTVGKWNCCPMPDAVCCDDGKHCCPSGYKCDVKHGSCVMSVKSVPRLPVVKSRVLNVVCPDGVSECPNNTTCCLTRGGYGCCPYPNAVCCSDLKHCCPTGSSCSSAGGFCLYSNNLSTIFHAPSHKQIPLTRKIPTISSGLNLTSEQKSSNGACPGGKSRCPEKSTCCRLPTDLWACCPVPNAICCDDGVHCCPPGTKCNSVTMSCTRNEDELKLPKTNKSISVYPTTNNLCPDHLSRCDDNNTCCELPDYSWGCCPLKDAVCCADRLHCCPSHTVCHVKTSMCVPKSQPIITQAVKMIKQTEIWRINKIFLSKIFDRSRAQLCPFCESDHTCCFDEIENDLACCPLSDGICCSGNSFCCPVGTRCLGDGRCMKISQESTAPFLIPSKSSNHAKLGFLPQTRFAGSIFSSLPNIRPADRNIKLYMPWYRALKSIHHTICPNNLHYCSASEQCCPSSRYEYVCTEQQTFCPPTSFLYQP